RFNALFREHYRFPPSHVRFSHRGGPATDAIRLTLSYRPPLAWREMLHFLAGRATAGVECIPGERYTRPLAVGGARRCFCPQPLRTRTGLAVESATSLTPELPAVLARLRRLFDLAARPDVIDSHLARDKRLAPWIRRVPGLRVPGAFDGFELSIRAILGQRVS